MTIPPRTTLITNGGFAKALISFKWSFFNFLTSAKVIYKLALAYATDASASAASFDASAFCSLAIFYSADTTFWTSSAFALSTVSFSINFYVSIDAFSNYGCICVSVTCIYSTALLAWNNLSKPFWSLDIEKLD